MTGALHQVVQHPCVRVDLLAQLAHGADGVLDRLFALAGAVGAGRRQVEHRLRIALRPDEALPQVVHRPLRFGRAGRLGAGVLELAGRAVEHLLRSRFQGHRRVAHLRHHRARVVAQLEQRRRKPADLVLRLVGEISRQISCCELLGKANHAAQAPREQREERAERRDQDDAARGHHREGLARNRSRELIGQDAHHQGPESGALLAGQPHPAVPVRGHAAGETAGGLVGARRFGAQVVIRQGALGYSAGRPGDDLPLLFHCAEVGDVAVRTEDLSEDFLGRSTVVERERQPQVLVAIEHLQHRGTAALDFHAEAVRLDPGENAADHRRCEGQPGEEKGDGARDQRCPPLPHQGTARSYASLTMNSRPGPGSGAWPALYGCA